MTLDAGDGEPPTNMTIDQQEPPAGDGEPPTRKLRLIIKLSSRRPSDKEQAPNTSINHHQLINSLQPPSSADCMEAAPSSSEVNKDQNVQLGVAMYRCRLCATSFTSDKALYGHMRVHSKREEDTTIKNTAPPPPPPMTPLCRDIVRWAAVTRRPRGSHKKKYPDEVQAMMNGFTAEDRKAVDDLMFLAGRSKKRMRCEVEVEEEPKKHDDDDDDDAVKAEEKNADEPQVVNLEQSATDNDNVVAEPELIKSENLTEATIYGSFACSACSKSFPTHQALGGHAASHSKGKEEEGGERPAKRSKKSKGSNSEHRCGTCNAVFPTGQALGGHMRAHYDPAKKKKPVPESTTTSVQAYGQKEIPVFELAYHAPLNINPVAESNSTICIDGAVEAVVMHSAVVEEEEEAKEGDAEDYSDKASSTKKVVCDFDLNMLPPDNCDEDML